MSEAATEVPILGIGREQTQAWTQAWAQTVLAIASALRRRRLENGRLAWSEDRDASRHADRLARLADPPVRTMTEEERRSWEFRRGGDHDLGVRPAQDMETRRTTSEDDGWVEATVGPLVSDSVGGAWGLTVNGFGTTSDKGEQLVSATIRCADELTAKRLADDLLRRGTDAVDRLHGFATLAAQRAESAANEVTEPEPLRLARTAAAVREAWAGYEGLADQAINPTPAQRAKGEQWNPAFGALASRLHELENRGYAMVDVLGSIEVGRLVQSDVRNVVAFAEYMVEEMTPSMPIVDLGPALAAGPGSEPAATDGAADPQPVRGSERWPSENARSAQTQEATIAPLLAEALLAELRERIQGSRYYPQLREDLYTRHERGRDVADLLARLPVEKIAEAGDPAAYLRAIVVRRSQERHMPAKTRVDRANMADLLERGFPRDLADRVVASPRWPGLARRLVEWNAEQLPVQEMLEALAHDWIMTREDPAECALRLMNSRATTERARRSTTAEATETVAAAGRAVDVGHADAATGTTDPEAPRPTATPTPERHEQDGGSAGPDPEHDGGQRLGAGSPRSGVAFDVDWTDDLDERSAVDRVGLEAAIGLGSAADDARLDDRLRREVASVGATSSTGARARAIPADTAEESAHLAADPAQARAGDHELDAVQHRATTDLPGTEEGEDLVGHYDVGRDEHLAAADRAAAAEERGAASAAVTRAEVTLTPDTAAADMAQPGRGREGGVARRGGQRPVRAPRVDPPRGRRR